MGQADIKQQLASLLADMGIKGDNAKTEKLTTWIAKLENRQEPEAEAKKEQPTETLQRSELQRQLNQASAAKWKAQKALLAKETNSC